ncbi:MAG: zinc ribbon domain-containing protein [Deltaproteobacteria bacterium]|nr:zinc ribbon domain-containing protein [Deltaproteobacteria bacterium]
MPIYEYRCNDCGKEFEVLQKFSDKPINKCIHCSGKKVEKLISQSSFVLKGGGWYASDYAGKKTKESPKEAAASPAPSCAGCPSRHGS